MDSFDFQIVTERYAMYFSDALDKGQEKLPYYEIAQWDRILNPVELRIFHDIKFIGVPLYPRFPVADNTYLHFANPFKRVGIEIEFKNSSPQIINRKVLLLKSEGWTIFRVDSRNAYHIIEEFFRFKRKSKELEFDDLTDEQQYRFVEKYHEKNIQCLLYYLKYRYFSNIL
ncbi:MAG: hypothetical protein EOO46_01205 [Flavobacterium sp.]|nr:MAG: hypothetical protein EOO46_01205 [Flavobacterium sp.]